MKAIARAAAIALGIALPSARAELVLDVKAPAFRVVVPHVPRIKVQPYAGDGKPHFRLRGIADPYMVLVMAPAADAGMGPKECAQWLGAQVSKRALVPAPEKQIRRRVDDNTFVVMYVNRFEGKAMLHAHLVSAKPGHCLEVYIAKAAKEASEMEPFFAGFAKASIRPR